jgi:naphtho-gamma-pyrone polyketide synthase
VSSSKTVGELMAAGVETVVLALRLGMCVFKVKDLLETNNSASPSWSVLVSGIREQEALELIEKFGNINVSNVEDKKREKD